MSAARRTRTVPVDDPIPSNGLGQAPEDFSGIEKALKDEIAGVVCDGLTPSSALELLIRLITEVPGASKDAITQIKLLDKLLNTARAVMETRLKSEEATTISQRLDELEARVERLINIRLQEASPAAEIRHETDKNP